MASHHPPQSSTEINMSNSMMDQLKKAGLVDKKKQQQVKKEKHKARRKPGSGNASSAAQAKSIAQDLEQQKKERDRALNRQRDEEAKRNAILAQINQLIENHRLPLESEEGDVVFNFTHNNKIKRLHVSEKIQRQLGAGHLAIVTINGKYDVVPRPVAEKIEQRNADHVIWTHSSDEAPSTEDDPYADFQIPDDLMW